MNTGLRFECFLEQLLCRLGFDVERNVEYHKYDIRTGEPVRRQVDLQYANEALILVEAKYTTNGYLSNGTSVSKVDTHSPISSLVGEVLERQRFIQEPLVRTQQPHRIRSVIVTNGDFSTRLREQAHDAGVWTADGAWLQAQMRHARMGGGIDEHLPEYTPARTRYEERDGRWARQI